MMLKPDWVLPHNVRAVMTTRSAGASAGVYAAGNLAAHVGDDPHCVSANRAQLQQSLGVAGIAWLEQVHGAGVVCADQVGNEVPVADASVARGAGRACAIMVADCLPVLFAAHDGSVVAAAHAGWRGLASGVLAATLARMKIAPENVTAWIGPGICARHYEVGEDVRGQLTGAAGEAAFTESRAAHYWFDLSALAAAQLGALGVRNTTTSGLCVYERADLFYSYRRDGVTGRCASLIWIKDEPGY